MNARTRQAPFLDSTIRYVDWYDTLEAPNLGRLERATALVPNTIGGRDLDTIRRNRCHPRVFAELSRYVICAGDVLD